MKGTIKFVFDDEGARVQTSLSNASFPERLNALSLMEQALKITDSEFGLYVIARKFLGDFRVDTKIDMGELKNAVEKFKEGGCEE